VKIDQNPAEGTKERKRHQFTEQDHIDWFVQLYEQNETIPEIALCLGVSKRTVSRMINKYRQGCLAPTHHASKSGRGKNFLYVQK
jgi:transposase